MWIPSTGLHFARMAPENATVAAQQKVWNAEMTHAVVWTWLGLNIAGQVLLTLLLATLLFSRRLKAQRHPILLNFVVTWLLSTIPSCLLMYGGAQEGAQPDPGLCLYNAALIAGVPPMAAVAFLSVVVQVFVMLRSVATHTTYVRRTWLTVLLLAGPYVAYVAFSLLVGVIGFFNPADVNRDSEIVFCSVVNHNIGTYVWSFTVLVVAVTFVLGVWIVVMLYRNWRDVRGGKVESEFDAHLIIRALAFTIFELFILATSLLTIFKEDSTPPKFMQALAPLAVFLIFATQPDVIYSWFFCFGRPVRGGDDGDDATLRASSPYTVKEKTATLTSSSMSTLRESPMSVQAQGMPTYNADTMRSYDSNAPTMRSYDSYPRAGTPDLRITIPGQVGPRPLYLASASAGPSSAGAGSRPMSPANTRRPPSHVSSASMGSSIGSARSAAMSMNSSIGSARSAAMRPQAHAHTGPPRAHGGRYHHSRSGSGSAVSSVYSAAGSVASQDPLLQLRTVDELRTDSRQGQSGSFHSHAGVLGGERF